MTTKLFIYNEALGHLGEVVDRMEKLENAVHLRSAVREGKVVANLPIGKGEQDTGGRFWVP